MNVRTSDIPGILIRAADFGTDPELEPAVPFSVIVVNESSRVVAFLGVLFELVDELGNPSSVVHYADTLRYPEAADFQPGKRRFVCAEPAYTMLAMRGSPAATARDRMNLDNLRRMPQITASVDCVAFSDGEFAGPDRQAAFRRLATERELEADFIASLADLSAEARAARLGEVARDSRQRVLCSLARKLQEGAAPRLRLSLWRPQS